MSAKWEDTVVPALIQILNDKLLWTSIDCVQLTPWEEEEGETAVTAKNIVWIAVVPDTVERTLGLVVVTNCIRVLESHGINNIEVEIRESEVSLLAGQPGQPLLTPLSNDMVGDFRHPLTFALGIPLSASSSPHIFGTGSFFLKNNEDLLLIVPRHIVLPSDIDNSGNVVFDIDNEGTPTVDILVPSETILSNTEARLLAEIPRQTSQDRLLELQSLLRDVQSRAGQGQVLGQLVYSPPFEYGGDALCECPSFTQDIAVIRVDKACLPDDNVPNIVHLGTHINEDFYDGKLKRYRYHDGFPKPTLLPIDGIVALDELRGLVDNCEDSLVVLKNGATTGTTMGQSQVCRYMSFTRRYMPDGKTPHSVSKQVPVHYLWSDTKGEMFSDKGDSGAAVVDRQGRLVGIINGGPKVQGPDITYVTPITVVLNAIQEKYPAVCFPDLE
ncbi:hypothetical protein MIND_00871900 [Mycena indigotica]|uniref:Uncharacterized protein n=1 Tax=Mycena indigotica TaxID=2126181 RepID=A0A8H6SJ21_9AGAR|nr:uncharacterized protein MIND_00871900 [Mycena indigotica]KAF7299232.1 hypothetical protein MIND_00871900 [Mycena indigotica]